jgi:hypothetical protein
MPLYPPAGGGGGVETRDETVPLGTTTSVASGINPTTVNIPGGAGASVGASWNFDTATGAADPGTKKFRLNNATLASVTAIYLNDTTVDNFDISTIASFLANGNRIYIQQKNDATRAALFQVTGPATDNTGWWTVPVTTIANSGVLYQNNAECGFVIVLSAAAGAGSFAVSSAIIAVPYGSSSFLATVVDGGVTGTSKIALVDGLYAQTDENSPNDYKLTIESTAAGSFTVRIVPKDDRSLIGGQVKIYYMVG